MPQFHPWSYLVSVNAVIDTERFRWPRSNQWHSGSSSLAWARGRWSLRAIPSQALAPSRQEGRRKGPVWVSGSGMDRSEQLSSAKKKKPWWSWPQGVQGMPPRGRDCGTTMSRLVSSSNPSMDCSTYPTTSGVSRAFVRARCHGTDVAEATSVHFPPNHSAPRGSSLSLLYPVRGLRIYVDCLGLWRKSDQLRM